MCEEVSLLQTQLGIYTLADWPIEVAVTQLNKPKTKLGIYVIRNTINNSMLIGEGKIAGNANRPLRHLSGQQKNKKFNSDLKEYGKDNFVLDAIVPCCDERERKLIENKLQVYYSNYCYNRPKRGYPTQQDLIEHKPVNQDTRGLGTIVDRLNSYTKVQRVHRLDECWESNYHVQREGYSLVRFMGNKYLHHVLMYILYYGDICGITSVIHHKCNNKRCVNPNHLESMTNMQNCRISNLKNVRQKKKDKISNFGVSIKNSLYLATVSIDNKNINLGYYNQEIKAARNRDYYIVKNNLWQQRHSTLNFHNIDYSVFEPYTMYGGKINKNLL